MYSFTAPDTSFGLKENHQQTGAHSAKVCALQQGGSLLSMLLLISAVLGILPLLGVVWIFFAPMRAPVDCLFMTLILLTLSGIFTLNLYWELRDRGMLNFLHKKKPAAPAKAPATKA